MIRRQRPREIQASRIVLSDPAGKTRILLDAGSENGFASINLFSSDGLSSIAMGTQPGGVVMSFNHAGFHGMLTLSAQGITLCALDGRFGITLGRITTETDSITVFKEGSPVWSVPMKKAVRPKRHSAPVGKRKKSRKLAA